MKSKIIKVWRLKTVKKNKWIGMAAVFIMAILIISVYIYKMNISPNSSVSDQRNDGEQTETKKYETEKGSGEAFEVRLRKYGFEVLSLNQNRMEDGSDYIEIELEITNYDGQEQILALNSVCLVIENTAGTETNRVFIENIGDINNEVSGTDYYHYQIPANSSSIEKLFFKINKSELEESARIALHFSPFGTEGAILYGKDENGDVVKIQDTENAADIFIESLLKGEE